MLHSIIVNRYLLKILDKRFNLIKKELLWEPNVINRIES